MVGLWMVFMGIVSVSIGTQYRLESGFCLAYLSKKIRNPHDFPCWLQGNNQTVDNTHLSFYCVNPAGRNSFR